MFKAIKLKKQFLQMGSFIHEKDCHFPIENTLGEFSFVAENFELLRTFNPEIVVIDLHRFMCDGQIPGKECKVRDLDQLYYADTHHLTIRGSKAIVYKAFEDAFNQKNN